MDTMETAGPTGRPGGAFPSRSLHPVTPERPDQTDGAALHCQCKCVTLCSSALSSADESTP
jgi:hypothetical protein